ncbi:MAG: GNAT family N-acetyltransferase [Pygmaiobacter sp.]
MYVRGATEEDLPQLYALCCVAAGHPLPQDVFEGVFHAAQSNQRRRLLVALEYDLIIGYADMQIELLLGSCTLVATIHEFYVCEDTRGRGIGSGMLIALSNQAKSIGCSEVEAFCSRVNLKSQDFLERHGFVRSQHQFVRTLK